MNKKNRTSCFQSILPFIHDLIYSIDQTLDYVYRYIELPLQDIFSYFNNISHCYVRRRSLIDFSRPVTHILVESYAITCFLYIILLLFGYVFSIATQRHYFIDPFLSNNRQCINIKFVRIINSEENNLQNSRLKENFIRENSIIKDENYQRQTHNYAQFYQLLHLIENNHYMICQRSLYIYARFHAYSSLLHSNLSQFQFFLPSHLSSFPIDQPPFIDLCVHTSNRSDLEEIKSRLLPLASYYYASINLFIFDFNFTQVTLTLYELNSHSTHLERVSIHTGWLYDIYSQFHFFKYSHALSTVVFDGLPTGQPSIDYFNYVYIPVPVDTLLGLTEMVQRSILVLPLCYSKYNTTDISQ
ncbi:unnamed protein product [Rotaria magnacalcarata]|uniref:Uncharacterized protein n=1 Tax=Rotaria magnacalcarata TaxID=392030 RepID=A0A815G627_9BILA|nr:unnamed protein product [Rotaria magnacalcarata]CAF1334425.1 unnamed protein product [Rotaria magnacalcarata]CAF3750713.1 unnamed protein product [Rotaria magnacalcarata]CAF3791448.1 unnamed protein product [Rotaria magnacalcarata]